MVEIKVNGEVIPFKPGWSIDLGKHGLIQWFEEPSAEAVRILQGEHQKEVRRAMEFVLNKGQKHETESKGPLV